MKDNGFNPQNLRMPILMW